MADYVYFKHTVSALPALADRDGEVDTNWNDNGNASLTADATHAHTGTKSFRLFLDGTGDLVTNYVHLASGNNATFAVGKRYVIAMWIWSASANTIQIGTGGVATSVSYTAADVAIGWVCKYFVFTAATATTFMQVTITTPSGSTIWFELEPFYEGDAFPVLIEKGLVRPEKFRFYPPIKNQYLDGSLDQQYKAFIRSLTLQTNTLSDAQLITYLNYGLDNAHRLDYDIDGTQETNLYLPSDPEQEILWRFDLKLAPYLEFTIDEGVARTVFP